MTRGMKTIGLALLLTTLTGCGMGMEFTNVEFVIDPPPSDVRTAGTLSGAAYSTGGEHYKTFHTLGSNLGRDIQTSADGRYTSN
jgi:hypothetical protein